MGYDRVIYLPTHTIYTTKAQFELYNERGEGKNLRLRYMADPALRGDNLKVRWLQIRFRETYLFGRRLA